MLKKRLNLQNKISSNVMLIGPSSTTNSKSLSITSISSDAGSTRQTSYVPDFTVRATGDVMYLQIRRAHYMAAYRATLMQREPKTPEVLELFLAF